VIYEKSVLIKLFHNKELQEKYLSDLLPAIFQDKKRKAIAFIMKKLNENKVPITVHNIVIVQRTPPVIAFLRKEAISVLTEDEVANEVFDMEVNATPVFFEEAFKELFDLAFFSFCSESIGEMGRDLEYRRLKSLLARAKAIPKVYDILYSRKLKEYTDPIDNAVSNINKGSAYQKFWSGKLNGVLGGWSKGWIGAVIGKPSHGKSTFMTYDSLQKIKRQMLDSILVISPEESPESFYTRVFAVEFGLPIKHLREGLIKITAEQKEKVKKLYSGKLIFRNAVMYEEVIDITFAHKGIDYIWLDHINAVAYPRGDAYNGIISLVNRQKEWLSSNSNSVIVNLSQVNTKTMKQRNRLFPAKDDAYMSSVLEQAAREFLSLYYPYKDYIDKEDGKSFIGKRSPRKDLIQVSIEKNSYGEIGILDFNYQAEIGRFADTPDITVGNIILPGDEPKLEL
jgi:replicative DNA helicase